MPATNYRATWHNLQPRIWGVEVGIINSSWLCYMLSDVEAWIEANI